MAKILDGRVVAQSIAESLARKIQTLKQKPTLAIIQIGNLAASNLYIQRKIKFAEQIGVMVELVKLTDDVRTEKVLAEIARLNQDQSISGIIVQLPLPENLSEDKEQIINAIAREKDVDGLSAGSPYTPATARGVLNLLDFYQIKIAGRKAVVVGRSALVGKPIALALLARNATVTICHRHTSDLAAETKQADILIVAAGSPNLIKRKHVKSGQIIIDVGLSLDANGKLVGDVDQAEVREIVEAISPVPGGVGPMTVASLFQNLMEAYGANMLESVK